MFIFLLGDFLFTVCDRLSLNNREWFNLDLNQLDFKLVS